MNNVSLYVREWMRLCECAMFVCECLYIVLLISWARQRQQTILLKLRKKGDFHENYSTNKQCVVDDVDGDVVVVSIAIRSISCLINAHRVCSSVETKKSVDGAVRSGGTVVVVMSAWLILYIFAQTKRESYNLQFKLNLCRVIVIIYESRSLSLTL